jgi:hypothetical protein
LDFPFFLLDSSLDKFLVRDWWEGKLKWLLREFERKELAQSILCVRYFPYRSSRAPRGGGPRLQSQEYGFSLVRSALHRKAVVVIMRAATRWTESVPGLKGRAFKLKNPLNVVLSPGNFEDGGFDRVVSAIRKDLRRRMDRF